MAEDLFAGPVERLTLFDFQSAGLDKLRAQLRAGVSRNVLCSPTGSGKTIMAAALTCAAMEKGSKVVFVTDRNALVDQTSETFDRYGIPHGIIQASHWRCRPSAPVQIVSAQTLARRIGKGGYIDDHLRGARLVIVDEAHTLFRATLDWLTTLPPEVAVIGLTATPFTRGLGRHYPGIVNVATTDELFASGRLVKPLFYSAVEADLSGVAVRSTGEWDEDGLARAGVKIIGDMTAEYMKRTTEHFGGPVKTIVFCATVPHGEEICRSYADIGLNFQLISYHDDEDDRRAKIAEFRKPDSAIMGLVSCDALSKGFDVPIVKVLQLGRPLRKSLSTHCQQLGRVTRAAPGKDKALVLDHTGNVLRFLRDTVDFWAHGVDELDERAEKDQVARSVSEKDRTEFVCSACRAVLLPSIRVCPACGHERPARASDVTVVSGRTQRIEHTANPSSRGFDFKNHPLLKDPAVAYQCLVAWTANRKRDPEGARRWARAMYRGVYDRWPDRQWDALPVMPELATVDVDRFCRREMARYSKQRPRHAA